MFESYLPCRTSSSAKMLNDEYRTFCSARRSISCRENPHLGCCGVPFIKIMTGALLTRAFSRDWRSRTGGEGPDTPLVLVLLASTPLAYLATALESSAALAPSILLTILSFCLEKNGKMSG